MKRNDNEDLAFLRQKAREHAPEAPESLSQENIEALVTGKKQNKHRRPVRAIVSVAVAACVMLTSAVVLRDTVIAPNKVKRAVKNAGTPVSYAEVVRRLEAQERASRLQFFDLTGGAKFATDDMAVAEAENAMPAAVAEGYGAVADRNAGAAEAHAETNVRTEGVLEADRVKTDGKYLYALAERQLFIVDPAGEMQPVASIDLSDAIDWGGEFYLLENRLLVVCRGYDDEAYKEFTSVLLYDISDPGSPARLRAMRFDGDCVSSRITDGRLLLVTRFWPDTDELDRGKPETFLPAYTVDDGAPCVAAEDSLYLGGGEDDAGFTTVSLLSLSQPDAEPHSVTLFGSVDEIYCAADTLYTYTAVYPDPGVIFDTADFSAATCIQKLDVSGDVPVIAATGSVSGTVLDTFALDESGGYLRVAAGDSGNGNRVYVLDGDLKQVGASEVLAQGETIRSVRFMGNYAYVVTFRQTDPLFVLDLSDPTAPALKGEVKLPGFSAYLHPAGEGYLVGIGYGGTETGLDGSAKVSVFDVRDPANPKETGALTLNSAWLNTDYKAFVTLPDGSFLLPFTKEEQVKNERPEEEEAAVPTPPDAPATAPAAEAETAAPTEEPETALSAAETPAYDPDAVAPDEVAPDGSYAVIEPATAAADAYWDGDYWEEYIWTVTPGALRVAVENGQPALRQTYMGEAAENDWPEARATFIGDETFLLSISNNRLRVDRFDLDDGTRTGALDIPVDTGADDPVVFDGARIYD